MIDKDNFRKLLVKIGFTKKGEVYEKKISDAATILKVDFKKQELIYPEDKGLIVNERQTCNFSTNENFVVFECVHRLLFNRTNSIEHVGKTGLFDLDGDYCFASYLVRVASDTSKVLPLFLVHMMNSPAYQAEAKGKASKSINQSNINATVMQNIKVPVPALDGQRLFVAKVEALEKQIVAAQAVIDAAPARKEAVMKKYL